MSVITSILAVLAIALVAASIVTVLIELARRQKERLADPLVNSVCPECNTRFGLTVFDRVHDIKISVDTPANNARDDRMTSSTVFAFSCPRCRTEWKYCEGALVKAFETTTRDVRVLPFAWAAPVFTQTTIGLHARRTLGSFLHQKEPFLYLSWFCAVALWLVVFPSFLPFYGEASANSRFEWGFAFMTLGLFTGIIAYFRCPEKRFARIAIGINSLPVIYGLVLFCILLNGKAWEIQMRYPFDYKFY